MKFNAKVEKIMNESLLEGNADYSDVMDSLKKLQDVVSEFSHVYPANRGTHIHASYKTEINKIIERINKWKESQSKFVQQTNKGANPDID